MARPDDDDPFRLETPRSAPAGPVSSQPIPTLPDPPSVAPTQPERKGGRRRTILLVATGVVLVACLVGALVGYFTYDRATKLDRSQPYVTLYQYLEFGFNQHDAYRARLFRCKDPDLGQLDGFLAELTDIEQQNNMKFDLQAANMPVQYGKKIATMSTNLILREAAKVVTAREVDPWEFRFRDEDGWRLCGAKRLPKPSPATK